MQFGVNAIKIIFIQNTRLIIGVGLMLIKGFQ